MTLAEQLAATTAKIDGLLVDKSAEESVKPDPEQLTAAELVAKVAAELATEPSKERTAYLKGVLEQLAKNNFEITEYQAPAMKEVKDPFRREDPTRELKSIEALVAGDAPSVQKGVKKAASEFTGEEKVAIITKLLSNKELLQKSQLTEKFDEICDTFGITESDLKDEYSVRWKIGDLLGALQTAIKVERLVGGASVDKATTVKNTEALPEKKPETFSEDVWPSDMAAAKVDPVSKAYVKPDLKFGNDKPAQTSRS